jgi:hypothetical protein
MLYGDSEFNEALKEFIRRDKKHPLYDLCVEHASEMAIHVFGDKPVELMAMTRPREEKQIADYRVDAYQPITKASANKAISITNKIFNPISYSVVWNEKGGTKTDDFKKYTTEYFPDYNSVITYVREVLTKKMLADPNGIAAVRPQRVEKDEAKRLKPIVKVFGSKSIISEDDQHFNILIRSEHDGGLKTFYFEYFDAFTWKSYKAVYKKSSVTITILEQYNHDFGEEKGIPAWKLRGISEANDNGDVMFKSYFDPALAYWNNAIIHEDDVKAAFVQHMHPIRWEASTTCTYTMKGQACRAGKIKFPDGDEDICPSCQGSGLKPLNSPFGAYKIPESKLNGQNGQFVPVGFVEVPTAATELLEKRAEKQQDKGLWALNMDISDKIGENQSAVAKVIDRSELQDFLYAISETVFDIHITNIYFYCALYQYNEEMSGNVEDILPQVNKPTNFDVATNSELVNNFKASKDSGLDRNYLLTKQIELNNKEFAANPQMKEVMNAILLIDPLAGYDVEQVNILVSQRVVTRTDAVVHAYIRPFIERAVSENKGFFGFERKKQLEILSGYAEEKEEETQLQLSEDMKNAIPPEEKETE